MPTEPTMPATIHALSTEIDAQKALTATAEAQKRGALAAYVELVDLVQLGFISQRWDVIESALGVAFPSSRTLLKQGVVAPAGDRCPKCGGTRLSPGRGCTIVCDANLERPTRKEAALAEATPPKATRPPATCVVEGHAWSSDGRPCLACGAPQERGTRVELVKAIEPSAPKRLSLVDPKADGPKADGPKAG